MSKLYNFEKVWDGTRMSYHNKTYANGDYTPEYFLAMDVFDEHIKLIKQTIERLENYPTCMSCYLNIDESIAATHLKERFIEILKEELL